MATGGVLGNGTKVAYSLASPMAFVRIGQVMNIDEFISLVRDKVDTTVYGTGFIRTNRPGMADPFTVKLSIMADLDPATSPAHSQMFTFQENGTVTWWRIEVPTSDAQTAFRAWEFQGYVEEVTLELPIDDNQKMSLSITYSGNLARYNPAASAIT